jgi:hypothetical protein
VGELVDRFVEEQAEMCRKAQAEGRETVVRDCIEAMKELQADNPLSSITSGLVKVAAVAAVVYVGGRYALPALVDAISKRRARP